MMSAFRDVRILPVVLVAIFGLVVLKVAGLVLDGGYVFDYDPQSTRPSWAQDMLNFPGGKGKGDPNDITGSVKKDEPPPEPVAVESRPEAVVINPNLPPPVSPSERAILERLQERRQELDARAREIDIRESLLKAAEKRIESKVEEARANDARSDAAAAQKADADAARFKGIVTMYEGMKPKDAAKVFDRLEMGVLYEIASQIAPRKMADILGQMQPEAAERLTVELARRANPDKLQPTAELPKIEGRMLTPKPN